MTSVKIYWTQFALKSLDEIKDYIEQETQSKTIAVKYVNKLIDRVAQLKKFKNSGAEEELLKQIKQKQQVFSRRQL